MSKKNYSLGSKELVALTMVAFICIILTAATFFIIQSPETIDIRMHLMVSNYTGFNLDTDALYFGTIGPEGSGSRDIMISNNHADPRKVRVILFGDLAGWVIPEEDDFILPGMSNRSLKFSVSVPKWAAFGEYEGTIRVILTHSQ